MTRPLHVVAALAALGTAAARAQPAPPCDATCHARAAVAAYERADTAAFLAHARRTRDLAPSHPTALYQLARAHALTGHADSAVALLRRVAAMGDVRDVLHDPALATLAARARLAAAFAANARPMVRGRLAFTIADPDLLPESIAYDAPSGTFLVGSLARHAVVRARPAARPADPARVEPFAGPAPDMPRVVGLAIDAARRRLWLAAWAQAGDTTTPLAARDTVDRSRLFAYDLATGARVGAWAPPDASRSHDLNDLVVTPAGDVYVTDTADDAVWLLRAGSDRLEPFVLADRERFVAPNGIARSGDGRRLYVAFRQGIAVIDVATGAIAYVELPSDVTTGGVDGLAWYRGDLIAVQTIPTLQRVVRFHLDVAGRRVVRAEVLDRAHPMWRRPTTGTVVGDTFYYVAASGFDRLADDGTLALAPGVAGTPFLRLDLRRVRR